jgi:hypothetical protein
MWLLLLPVWLLAAPPSPSPGASSTVPSASPSASAPPSTPGSPFPSPAASPEPGGAVIGKNLKNAVQKYRDALARARWSAGYGSLGGLYAQARSLGPDRTPVIASETRDFLEKATPVQKQRFVDDLTGLHFGAPEDPPIPDIAFYIELNRTSREKESEHFFGLIHGIYSKTFVRAYEDPKGKCTRLGKDQAVGIARSIKSAEAHMPHYKTFLDAEKTAVMRALLTTCACNGPADSEREIQDFIKSFPKDPGVPKLTDFLGRITAGDPSLQFQCSGGAEPTP